MMPAYDEDRYDATPGQTDFSITFDYNLTKPATVKVYVDGILQTLNTEYTLPTTTLARFGTPMVGGEYVLIRRLSDFVDRPGEWQDEDRLTDSLHNQEDSDGFRRDQELRITKGLPRSRTRSAWDGQNDQDDATPVEWPVSNIADPTALQDVVTLNFLQDYISGGSTGISGVFRSTGTTTDGQTKTFTLIPAGEGQISDKNLVTAALDGVVIDPTNYEVTADKRGIVFDQELGNGITYDIYVITAAMPVVADGSILPQKLALAQDNVIVGDASGFGSSVARNTISLSSWGAATADLDLGLGGSNASHTNANNKKATHVQKPTNNADAATKQYVDEANTALRLSTSGATTALTFLGTAPSTIIQNAKTYTAFYCLNAQISGHSSSRQIEINISAASDMSGAVRVAGFTHTGGTDYRLSAMFAVPSLWYWQASEINTRDVSGDTFAYQTIN